MGIHITDDLTWTVNTQHTEEIKAKTVQPVTAAPNHQSISSYSAGDLQEKTYLPAPKVVGKGCKGFLTS